MLVRCRCGNRAAQGCDLERSHDVAEEREQAGDEAPEHNQDCPGDQADHSVPHAPHRGLQEHEPTYDDEQ